MLSFTQTNPVVYFTDKTVAFLSENASVEGFDIAIRDDGLFSPTKIIHFLETCNRIAVLSAHPENTFRRFAEGFTKVEAAGGAVFAPDGRLLTMKRRGRLDLPKGHVEEGETYEQCALREVREETGVEAHIVGHICDTLHAYEIFGRLELKRTHWYAMRADEAVQTTPQHEEDIEIAEWSEPRLIGEALAATYPTIRCVMESLAANPVLAPFLQSDNAIRQNKNI